MLQRGAVVRAAAVLLRDADALWRGAGAGE